MGHGFQVLYRYRFLSFEQFKVMAKKNRGTAPCFRRLSADLLPRRPGFDTRQLYVEFVLNEEAVRHVLQRGLWYSLATVIPLDLHNHSSIIS
jgi:hypothetical protein